MSRPFDPIGPGTPEPPPFLVDLRQGMPPGFWFFALITVLMIALLVYWAIAY